MNELQKDEQNEADDTNKLSYPIHYTNYKIAMGSMKSLRKHQKMQY